MPTKRNPFNLIDRQTGTYLDVDLSQVQPGQTLVVPSARRLTPEKSHSYIHALWWVWLEDGRSVLSVPPGAEGEVAALVAEVDDPRELYDEVLIGLLAEPVDRALRRARRKSTQRIVRDLWFGCDAEHLVQHHRGDCRRLVDLSLPHPYDFLMPDHCFPGAEGAQDPGSLVYGVVADGQVVSVAYAHRTGILEDQVAELGVATDPAYQGRGYAQTCVSALVAEMVARGGQARYGCNVDNLASLATARSVGFQPYATVLELVAPRSAAELAREWQE